MFNSAAWSVTQSTPAITWVMSTAPELSATFTDTMPARGATPMNHSGWAAACAGSAPGVAPAMMPAMWVPWPNVSMKRASLMPASADRSTTATTCCVKSRDRGDAGVDHRHVHAGPVDAPRPQRAGTDLVDDPVHRPERQLTPMLAAATVAVD